MPCAVMTVGTNTGWHGKHCPRCNSAFRCNDTQFCRRRLRTQTTRALRGRRQAMPGGIGNGRYRQRAVSATGRFFALADRVLNEVRSTTSHSVVRILRDPKCTGHVL